MSEFQVDTIGGHIAPLAGGGFVAVALTGDIPQPDGTERKLILAQLYDPSGIPVGPERQLHALTDWVPSLEGVAALADGGFVVTWAGSFGSSSYALRCDATGQPIDTAFELNPSGNYYQTSPDVVGTSDGGFILAWETGFDDPDRIFFQRYDAEGKAEQAMVTVDSAYRGGANLPSQPTRTMGSLSLMNTGTRTSSVSTARARVVLGIGTFDPIST